MSKRSPQSSSFVERLRRHWLLVAIVSLAFVVLWAGQPAQAADARPNVNQTVPPATPRPEVPPPDNKDNKDKKDNKEEENKPAEAPAAAPAAAQGTSSIVANNQESDGASVTVSSVTSAGDGWVVIHADDGGKPGAVLGHTAVPGGTTDNVVVLLDPPLAASGQLWAMLHVDAGTVGTYEFPGADAPATDNGNIVVAPFTVTITGATAAPEATTEAAAAAAPEATAEATVEATAEATAEATVEATAEATVEATVEATAEATVEATAEATAETAVAATEATAEPAAAAAAEAAATAEQTPESLPATGGETSLPLVAGVAGAALLMLAGAAFATRRSA